MELALGGEDNGGKWPGTNPLCGAINGFGDMLS